MKTRILALLLLFFMGLGASAQGQEMDNMTDCLKNVSLYTDYVKQNNIQEALPFWHRALCCCPDTLRDKYRNSYVNLFVNGIRIMKYQIDNATDEALKDKYVDSMLWMYDQRMEVLPSQRKTSLWRKAADYARYRPQDVREIYNLCLESIEMLDDKTDISTIVLAMQQASSLYSESNLSADSVMWLYMELSTILDKQSKTKDVTPVKETLDDMFIRSGVANCENLIAVYTPKFKENPKDVEMLEKLVSLLSANQCTQDKLYFDATEALLRERPSAEAAVQAAQMFRQQGNYSKAEEYYKKAIDMETSNEAKSKYYVELGNITNRDLSKPQEARNYAKKALELDSKNGHAYLLLGEIYASVKDCGSNDLEQRSVYWIVVDCFEKAKQVDPSLAETANKYITVYRQYFPSKEDIFFHNLERGNSYTVPCWINEKTTIRPRD